MRISDWSSDVCSSDLIEDSVDLNRWSADVGSINVSAGELQITGPAYDPTDADGAYIGIQGNIVVDGGSLVFGRRTLIDGGLVGGSITSADRKSPRLNSGH